MRVFFITSDITCISHNFLYFRSHTSFHYSVCCDSSLDFADNIKSNRNPDEKNTGETLTLSIQTALNSIGLLALCIRFCCVYPASANPGHCRRITFFHITLFALYLFALGYFFHCGLHAWKNYESNPKNKLGLGYNILTIFYVFFFINIFFYV